MTMMMMMIRLRSMRGLNCDLLFRGCYSNNDDDRIRNYYIEYVCS